MVLTTGNVTYISDKITLFLEKRWFRFALLHVACIIGTVLLKLA